MRELLQILDETDEDRQALMVADIKREKDEEKAIDQKPSHVQQQAHLGPGIVQSMKKYENIKL